MQKLDALVVGAMEVAQSPLSLEILQSSLPSDHVFLELWPQIADITILHPLQALNIVERLDEALNHPGDVIECGIYQGVTSILMAKLMELRQSEKKLFLFDSFEGLPEPDRQVDADHNFQKGGWSVNRKDVEALLEKHDVLQRCEIVEGWFSQTLPTLDDGQQFCFAYFDADLYSSTKDCLTHVWHRLSQHAIAVFDDYHHPSGGVRKAVDDWLAESGEIIHVGPASQSFVIRGLRDDSDTMTCYFLQTANGKEIIVSFDYLRRNSLFCSLVESRQEKLRAYAAQLDRFASLLRPGDTPAE